MRRQHTRKCHDPLLTFYVHRSGVEAVARPLIGSSAQYMLRPECRFDSEAFKPRWCRIQTALTEQFSPTKQEVPWHPVPCSSAWHSRS